MCATHLSFTMGHVLECWTRVSCPKKPKGCGPQNVESGGHVRTVTCLIASEVTIQMFAQLVGDAAATIALLQSVTEDVTLFSDLTCLDPAISVRGHLLVEHISLSPLDL